MSRLVSEKNKINIKKWSSRRLKAEAMELYDLIYNQDCFGTKDMILLEMIIRELEKRGLSTKTNLTFIRK